LPKTASNDSCAIDTVSLVTCQAVKMLHEEVGSQPEGTCGDMLVLPIYAALPPELQVRPPCCSSSPTMCTTLVVNKENVTISYDRTRLFILGFLAQQVIIICSQETLVASYLTFTRLELLHCERRSKGHFPPSLLFVSVYLLLCAGCCCLLSPGMLLMLSVIHLLV